jgi:hypothetical protein
MKRYGAPVLLVVLSALAVTLAYAGMHGHMKLAEGDEVYACDCGEACPCDTMSRTEGKCTCDKEMVKAKVAEAGEESVELEAEGWEGTREFSTHGKYACACGPECPCDTISQNAGKCTCGVEMEKVEG